MAKLGRLLTLALVAALLMPLLPPGATHAQEDAVARLMAKMSPAAKVGQLFLVTFPGSKVTDDAAITELIRDYHVGGVVLLAENGNIVNDGDTLTQVATLVGQLQEVAWAATQPVTGTAAEESAPGPFIPLFVAVNHEGNGMPFTGILSGTTPLPSAMALGATWNPAYAETVGQIVGRELRALGINMLLGPLLDVLETPNPASTGDLGVRSFGGDPFWVGQMGQAYIRGVHTGADGQIAVIVKHFPGLGASDRSLDEEAPTVQRTLEKLRQIDLAPFFAVAQAEDMRARPDGILVSHIRFRGLEGGRFVTTRPISVDSQALQRFLAQPELAGWRQAGGLTVSDGLGLRALRRFYDPNEASFNSRRIAQEAFLAGNDLLLLSQFALTGSWDEQVANIESTITFFQEKYEADPAFQAAVDAAVARILRLKLVLYGSPYGEPFRLSAVQPNLEALGEQVKPAQNQTILAAIGRDAVTLLSPPSPDLVPDPPALDDDIVIFTDARQGRPCATCAPFPYVDSRLLQETIARLYGPAATGQISPRRISSFTFGQLEEYLSAPPPTPTPTPTGTEESTPTPIPPNPVETALRNADWIIFAMLNPNADPPQSAVVRRFLAERADTLRGPYLVVLAYDAPYYLDATEISKLSAYYVTYSRITPFVEASVRALFGEFAPAGMPPVSVAGINYNLAIQISPDPNQTIPLYFEIVAPAESQPTTEPGAAGSTPTASPQPTVEGQPTPEARPEVGNELRLRTGVILDRNGHPVPDGTPVQFIFTYPQEGLESSVSATTRGGVAETTYILRRTGQLDVYIQVDPVPRTLALQITIQEGKPPVVITPTPRPTRVPTPRPTTPPPVEETPQPTSMPENERNASEAGAADLIWALLSVGVVGAIGYYGVRANRGPLSRALRLALWCVIGGLALYLAYALRLPGSAWLREQSGAWAGGWVALFGSMIPLVVAWIVAHRGK